MTSLVTEQAQAESDLWAIIGAKLGFVNIPGTDTEPARSGPAFAHRLQAIYKEFLLGFDLQYRQSMVRRAQAHLEQQRKAALENGLQQPQNRQPAPAGVPAHKPANEVPEPKLMGDLVSYSVIPAAELQRRGVPHNVIQLVEQNRVKLREMHDSQRSFHNGVEQNSQNGQNQAGGVPQRNVSNPMMEMPQQNGMPMQNGMSSLGQPNGQQMHPQGPNHGMAVRAMPQMAPAQQQQPGTLQMRPVRPSAAQQQLALEMVARVKDECKGKRDGTF